MATEMRWLDPCSGIWKNVMEKKNKSLIDDPEGKIILNESGTSVSMDDVEEGSVRNNDTATDDAIKEDALGNKDVKEDEK